MSYVVTSRAMRAAEAEIIRGIGWPGAVLMERAALAVDAVVADTRGLALYLCGTGNNGGDGLAAARLAAARGRKVAVVLVNDGAKESEGIALQTALLARAGVTPITAGNPSVFDAAVARLCPSVIVDALYGIGYHPPMPALAAHVLSWANAQDAYRIAVDLPSGLVADGCAVSGPVFCAAQTVTFGWMKPAHVLHPARGMCGDVTVADIGLMCTPEGAMTVLSDADCRSLLPVRARDAHKKNVGHAALVAGSKTFAGAAALSTLGALRGGAGLVTLMSVPDALPACRVFAPEALLIALDADECGFISENAASRIPGALAGASALAIGPGFGLSGGSAFALIHALEAGLPLIIDADALTLCAREPALWKRLRAPAVITPHAGEASRILGKPAADVMADPVLSARELASLTGATALLKGATTVIAQPEGGVTLNLTGTQGMATGGSGDVLTGLIAALLAQGLCAYDAARAGAYIHGRAGEIAEKAEGVLAMCATDIARAIGAAYLSLKGA